MTKPTTHDSEQSQDEPVSQENTMSSEKNVNFAADRFEQ